MKDDDMPKWVGGYANAARRGPFWLGVKIMLLVVALLFAGTVVFGVFGWFSEGAAVVQEEFGPRALLKKYEYFKDVAAKLEAKQATLSRMEKRPRSMEKSYGDTPRKDWDRVDKQQHSLWLTEIEGVAASFNDLAADYNANMAKENWRFCEIGRLPQGATQPLPREFKGYLY